MFRRGFEHAVALTLDDGVRRVPADGMIISAGAHEAIDLCAFDFCRFTGDCHSVEA